jgi:hypothetical protein
MAIEIMDAGQKRRMGLYSFLPLLAFGVAGAYHMLIFKDEVASRDMEDHIALATETARHFTPLAMFYGTATVITLAVLLYFIIHLLRIKHMASGAKLFWAVMLTMFIPFSFPVFWYTMIRKEPKRLEVHRSL